MGHRQFPSLVSDFGGLATGDKEKNDDDDLSLGDLGIAADIDTAAADIHLAQTVRSLLKSARLRVFLEQLQQSLAVFSGPALLLGTCLLLRGDGYAAATAAAAMTTKTTKKKEEAAEAVTALRPSVPRVLVFMPYRSDFSTASAHPCRRHDYHKCAKSRDLEKKAGHRGLTAALLYIQILSCKGC